ncbi:helix-turn-helix domain-containing protein [Georgenia thermotolerans]|uniref:helix-turn-helix domain-containing protein n=1 Tax=Georgenia thermotolerans TaxID=527326 RepID=UPI0012649FB2|nr:helix-turn-helix domain-containing protein [Georgenia thermotolerans]
MSDVRLMTVEEAAAALNLSEYTVRAEQKRGRLPYRRVGRFIRFTEADLDAYTERIRGEEAPTLRRTAASQARRRAS